MITNNLLIQDYSINLAQKLYDVAEDQNFYNKKFSLYDNLMFYATSGKESCLQWDIKSVCTKYLKMFKDSPSGISLKNFEIFKKMEDEFENEIQNIFKKYQPNEDQAIDFFRKRNLEYHFKNFQNHKVIFKNGKEINVIDCQLSDKDSVIRRDRTNVRDFEKCRAIEKMALLNFGAHEKTSLISMLPDDVLKTIKQNHKIFSILAQRNISFI